MCPFVKRRWMRRTQRYPGAGFFRLLRWPMKPVPKHISAAARAQFFLIGRALVHGIINRDIFEALIHEWLAIIAPLLKDSGFDGKEVLPISRLVARVGPQHRGIERTSLAHPLRPLHSPHTQARHT